MENTQRVRETSPWYLLCKRFIFKICVFRFHSFHVLLQVLDILACSEPAFVEGETVGFRVVQSGRDALASGLRMVTSGRVSAAVVVARFLGRRVSGDGVTQLDLFAEENLRGENNIK